MRVLVTGATGFIGSALVGELISAGHAVVGLTRTEAGAKALAHVGAEPHEGSLEDLGSLKQVATACDGVIHLAFNHDFSQYVANCEVDRQVITALGEALAGSNRTLLVTSGVGMRAGGAGRLAREDDPPARSAEVPRAASEEAAEAVAALGVNVGVVRLPQVHDRTRHGLVTLAVQAAREKGVSAYIGEGDNRWAAAHRVDTARLYRLALERAAPGARYHAVAEEGVSMRDIAEAIGRRLDLPAVSIPPEEAPGHFGFLAAFAATDLPASSEKTRQSLGWRPSGPGMIEDLENLEVAEP